MITVLQRQNVSKRSAPSVNPRQPSRGVSWSAIDLSRNAPAPLSRAVLASQSPRKSRVPASRRPGIHRFLEGQFIGRARRRSARRAARQARASAAAERNSRHGTPWIARHGTPWIGAPTQIPRGLGATVPRGLGAAILREFRAAILRELRRVPWGKGSRVPLRGGPGF